MRMQSLFTRCEKYRAFCLIAKHRGWYFLWSVIDSNVRNSHDIFSLRLKVVLVSLRWSVTTSSHQNNEWLAEPCRAIMYLVIVIVAIASPTITFCFDCLKSLANIIVACCKTVFKNTLKTKLNKYYIKPTVPSRYGKIHQFWTCSN